MLDIDRAPATAAGVMVVRHGGGGGGGGVRRDECFFEEIQKYFGYREAAGASFLASTLPVCAFFFGTGRPLEML